MSVYDIGQFNTATQELSRACSELEQLRSQPDAIVDAKKTLRGDFLCGASIPFEVYYHLVLGFFRLEADGHMLPGRAQKLSLLVTGNKRQRKNFPLNLFSRGWGRRRSGNQPPQYT